MRRLHCSVIFIDLIRRNLYRLPLCRRFGRLRPFWRAAGFLGGRIDRYLMAFSDFVVALPFLLFMILFMISIVAFIVLSICLPIFETNQLIP